MTPAQWLTTDARALIIWLDSPALRQHKRQICLFCHACCQRLLPKHPPPIYSRALAMMLEAAEGKTGFDDLNRIGQEVMRLEDDLTRIMTYAQAIHICFADQSEQVGSLHELIDGVLEMRGNKENEPLSNIVRDIFGNQFYHVVMDPRWISSTVLDLARTIDMERCYERLPILADALMDAGCDDEALLRHCQQPAEHVKGCWAVDLLLART